jgi:hypothetical protein
MLEVEVRGKLENFSKTLKELKKKAKFIQEKDRFTLIYFRDNIKSKDELKNALESDPIDLKIRVSNKKAEFVLKYGFMTGCETRREILIPIDLDKFDEAVDFLKFLNWGKGVIMATKTFVFDYKGIEFALVQTKGADYFEAELVIEEKDSKDAMRIIKGACQELGLKMFEKEEFIEFLDNMNQREEFLFDFYKFDFKEQKKKFIEFFKE